ncbi:MAG: peptidylprolyl isomerase [Thermodesulfovibrionales bacterium]
MKRVLVFLFIVSLLFACTKKEEKNASYLAKVGNTIITEADLEREIKNLPDFVQKMFEGASGRQRFLDELIKREILYQEALKKGLDKDPVYQRKLEDFKKMNMVGLLLEKEIETKTKISDKEVRDYYEQHKEDFAPVSQVRLSHIVTNKEEDAQKILERLKKGEDFAMVAKKDSIDTVSAKKGGDLGFFSRGDIPQEFRTIAVRMKTGEVSDPIKTKSGYEIIKVTDKKVGQVIEFEKIKNLISQNLLAEKQKESFDSYIEGLRKKYKVEINKEALSKLAPSEERQGATGKPEQMEAPRQGAK